ncbi:MAG: helix-turn-helix transcriptional regulator, partial [Thermoanaerobaculia bacterium]|nr:helix-turn-helix transcriptional regulator [Thermoanaerobaculia bacterium]
AQRAPSQLRQSASVEAARALLVEHYHEPLQLEDVASAAGISPFHLCRLFKRSTGLPIHRYLTRLRLATALERVVEGCTDLADLAFELGFSSHSHLSSAFRKELGLAPSEVRRQTEPSRPRRQLGR